MSNAYQVTVAPTIEPISVEEAKLYARVDYPDEDATIARLITASRQHVEALIHKALATQTIQCIETIARPSGGELSGPITRGPNWYEYQEQLGANPFGAAMFYFDLPMPPCQRITLIETRTTVWDSWTTFSGNTTLDTVPEPARLYFQVPVTANQWRFTYVAGYDPLAGRPLPAPIRQALLQLIAFWYDHREDTSIPEELVKGLLTYRVDWL